MVNVFHVNFLAKFLSAHSSNFLSVCCILLVLFRGGEARFLATGFGLSAGLLGQGALGARTVFTLGFLAVVRVAFVDTLVLVLLSTVLVESLKKAN
jgi:hypothetical protein